METNYENLLNGRWRLVGRVIFHNGKVIGLLNPSLLIGKDNEDKYFALGKNGVSISEDASPESIWVSIIEAGGVLFGNDFEVNRILGLFNNESTSRTLSYFLNIAKDCNELIDLIKKINSSSILILGAGGIGSISAMLLAGAGVRKITILDGDKVEKSNLNRQLFYTLGDIGSAKVKVLENEIRKRFENIEIDSIYEKVKISNLSSLAKNHDITLSTIDEPVSISNKIAALREVDNLNIVQSGYLFLKSRVYYNVDFSSKRLFNYSQLWKASNSIVPSYGPSNAELAGLASSLILMILCGKVDSGTFMEFNSSEFPRQILSL